MNRPNGVQIATLILVCCLLVREAIEFSTALQMNIVQCSPPNQLTEFARYRFPSDDGPGIPRCSNCDTCVDIVDVFCRECGVKFCPAFAEIEEVE